MPYLGLVYSKWDKRIPVDGVKGTRMAFHSYDVWMSVRVLIIVILQMNYRACVSRFIAEYM